MVEPGNVYRHFKGGLYIIIDKAIHSETQETLILYAAILDTDDKSIEDIGRAWDKNPIWARPERMFTEFITRDGKTFPRFSRVNEDEF